MADLDFSDLIPKGGKRDDLDFSDLIPRKDPKIGQPEDLTFAERLVSGVKMPQWMDDLRKSQVGRTVSAVLDPTDLAGDLIEGRSVRANPLVSVLRGAMSKPAVGVAQLAANVLPDATGVPQAVNSAIADEEAKYQAARREHGREGFDVLDTVGQVASPYNLLAASKLAPAATALARAGQGALVGAATAAAAPITDTSDGYFGKKGAQVATAAATGGVLAPALGALADKAAVWFGANIPKNVRPSLKDVDLSLTAALKETGQSLDDVPPDQLAALRSQVAAALEKGQNLDAAAALRKADFDSVGVTPTAGQVTRDPTQFSRETRLAAFDEVGQPIQGRFAEQARQIAERMPKGSAQTEFQAGTQLSDSLAGVDEKLRNHVSGLYSAARDSAGRELEIPLTGLAQDYARILDDFGDRVPTAIRGKFAALGLDPANPSNQKRLFTMADADALQKVINQHMGSDRATNTALGQLRASIRSAVEATDATGGPYAPAVQAAAARFKMHDAIPALKAAAEGSTAPDDFVRKFIVNGKVNDVKGLAKVLEQADPAAYQEARAQLADVLRRAAFGENAAGDAGAKFAPQRYMATLRQLRIDKLEAFFTPAEIRDITTLGRVMGYISQEPAGSAVNRSNTAGAVMSLLSKVPGAPAVIGLGNTLKRTVENNSTVRSALNASVPSNDVPLDPATRNAITRWLLLASGGAGAAMAGK